MNRLPAFPWLLSHLVLAMTLVLPAPPASAQDKADEQQEGEGEGMKRFWNRFRRPSIYQRGHDSVKEPFAAVVGKLNRSTVRVMVDGDQAALGTVVGDGLILTKASELRNSPEMECELFDGRKLAAEKVGANEDYDLALLRVAAQGLTPVKWFSAELPVGAWLVTPGTDDMPVSIGVVSTTKRGIPKSRALLGVRLGPNPREARGGARVGMVFPNSGAERAGVKVGDVIIGADDDTIASPDDLIAHVSGMLPGDRVKLKIARDKEEKTLTAELTDEEALSQSRVEVQNSLGGPISRRRSGFPKVIQHDSVLRPEQCGGPLLNLDGKVIGLNIARAGRVASYALPAEEVIRLLPSLVGTIDTFRDQERELQILEFERKILRSEQMVSTFEGKLKVAVSSAEPADGKSKDDLEKARQEVAKLNQLVKDAADRVKRLNQELTKLRAQQPAKKQ